MQISQFSGAFSIGLILRAHLISFQCAKKVRRFESAYLTTSNYNSFRIMKNHKAIIRNRYQGLARGWDITTPISHRRPENITTPTFDSLLTCYYLFLHFLFHLIKI